MPSTDISVATLDGTEMPAFLAWPEGDQRWPTAVVLGELFGLTDVQRDAAERVAAMGYVAIAPDLLHRRAPGGPLPEDEEGRRQGLALIDELTRLELVSDVRDALHAACGQPHAHSGAPAVAVGLSFGGHVAMLATARLDIRACVAMYAGWLAGTAIAASRPEPTGSLPLAGRLLILVGEADPMVPASDIAALRAWQPEAQVITYPRVGHRFCSVGRPGYDPEVAADAWAQTTQFLT
ncbi:MAG: dienelactone hydrolase family protein [Actinomycetota bacterium]|nr:dienelactone hydrolase family protein [Actinomycetota bacterium]